MSPRDLLGPVQPVGGGLGENLVDERALARTGNPANDVEQADGKGNVDFLKVVCPGSPHNEGFVGWHLFLGVLVDAFPPGKEGSGNA